MRWQFRRTYYPSENSLTDAIYRTRYDLVGSFGMAQVADRLNAELDQKIQLDATAVGKGLAKYRQTILFAITALLVMSIAQGSPQQK